jgi:hypothetical protein
MKKILEIIVCILFHPIAVVLMWIQLSKRQDMGSFTKVALITLALIPFVPLVYTLLNQLW